MRTEAVRRAESKYRKNNVIQLGIKLYKNTEADLIEYIESLENKQGFIKELIRREMEKSGY